MPEPAKDVHLASDDDFSDVHAAPTGRRLAFGAGVVGGVNIVKALLQLVMLPLMARLLSPSEFGLYALALPAVALFSMLADGGLGASLAREPESSPIWSSAFWILVGSGVVLAGGLIGWGFALSALTHQPRLPALMMLLSVSVLLLTMSVCPGARLVRRGRLATEAGADLAGNFFGAAVGLLLAVRGAGAFSLAGQFVSVYAIRAVILNAAAFHCPRFELRPSLLRGHLTTGGSLLGARLSDFIGRLSENSVFGWTLGTSSLGVYTFANQMPRFICEAAGNPLWSALYVRALRGDRHKLAALHAQLCRLLGMMLFPVAALVAAAAPELIALLLGPKWVAAGPLVRLILPSYVLTAISSQSGAILLAYGRFEVQFYCFVGLSAARIAAVCTAPWTGLFGVGCGIAIANGIYAAAMLFLPANISGCRPPPILRGLSSPFLASLIGGATTWVFLSYFGPGIIWLIASLLTGSVAYVASILIMDWTRLQADIRAIRPLIGRAA